MAAEDENYLDRLITSSLSNAAAKSVLTHVGVHQYDAGYISSNNFNAKPLTSVANAGKRVWQTEISNYGGGGNLRDGRGIENALMYADMVHHDLVITELTGFLYWWLFWEVSAHTQSDSSNPNDAKQEALVHIETSNQVTAAKRLWAIGQWSRFVRPGWWRVTASHTPRSSSGKDLYSSAYRSPNGDIAIVWINDTDSDASNLSISVDGGAIEILKAYRTSETEDLAEVSVPTTAGGANISGFTLPKKSITTFVGRVQ
jgi:glucuronoarabinoxylan endo-1,4-beta-xylanase